MPEIEQKELEGHRDQIDADVKKLVEKYRAILTGMCPISIKPPRTSLS